MMSKNVNIDVVRIFATLLVLSVHICQVAGFDFSVGAKGVQCFFVLSGYLTFVSLSRKDSAIEYYKKRIVRILPTYWICLILVYVGDILLGIWEGLSLDGIFAGQCGFKFLRYFFFLQMFTPTDNWNLWNNHRALWTMSCFAFFYILAPFLYKIMKKFYVGLSMLIMFLLSTPWLVDFVQRVLAGYPEEAHIEWFASMNPLSELYCFLIGAFLFFIIDRRKEYFLFLIPVIMTISSFEWYSYELLFALMIAIAVKIPAIFKNPKICKVISWISDGSFTVYLTHPTVMAIEIIIWRLLGFENNIAHAVSLYIVCMVSAYLLYYLVISRVEKRIYNIFYKKVRY